MAISALPGALIVFGQAPSPLGQAQTDYNTTDSPSMFNIGAFTMDPRAFYTYNPGSNYTYVTYGWGGVGRIPVIDQVPTTISTNSVAQTQIPSSVGAALTLTASNTTNVTVGVSITAPETGQTVTGLLAIDGAMGSVTFGSDANIAAWDPTKAISRCITISVASSQKDDSAGVWTITGRDIYGFKISEQIVGSSIGSQLTSQKAYKYIATIAPSTQINSTGVIVGVSDVYGLPLYASNGAYVTAYWNNALVVSSTNFTAAMGTSVTATSTTADVRGTFASSAASNSTIRLVMAITPSVAAMAFNSGNTAGHGLIGGVQYSSV